jgi:hypothetical protein
MFLTILTQFEELYKNGHDVVIEWYYDEGDDGIEEIGKTYAARLSVPFNIILTRRSFNSI